MYVVNK